MAQRFYGPKDINFMPLCSLCGLVRRVRFPTRSSFRLVRCGPTFYWQRLQFEGAVGEALQAERLEGRQRGDTRGLRDGKPPRRSPQPRSPGRRREFKRSHRSVILNSLFCLFVPQSLTSKSCWPWKRCWTAWSRIGTPRTTA